MCWFEEHPDAPQLAVAYRPDLRYRHYDGGAAAFEHSALHADREDVVAAGVDQL
jgi:hypothetical protein